MVREAVVIKRKGKWYNTLSGRYVSESTAKRYNSFFKKNPKAALSRAYGGYKYQRKRRLAEHSESIHNLLHKKTQLVKTKDKKGRTVYYSPVHERLLTERQYKKFLKLDYAACNNRIQVHLYRLTKDRNNLYHVFNWKVNRQFRVGETLQAYWETTGWRTVKCLKREIKEVNSLHPLGDPLFFYGHVSFKFYSEIDWFPMATTFGFYFPDRHGIDKTFEELDNILYDVIDKLSSMSYHLLLFDKISLYLYTFATEQNKQLAKYRLGVLQ